MDLQYEGSKVEIIGRNEDTAEKGNYVFTLRAKSGNIIQGVERKLTSVEVE